MHNLSMCVRVIGLLDRELQCTLWNQMAKGVEQENQMDSLFV